MRNCHVINALRWGFTHAIGERGEPIGVRIRSVRLYQFIYSYQRYAPATTVVRDIGSAVNSRPQLFGDQRYVVSPRIKKNLAAACGRIHRWRISGMNGCEGFVKIFSGQAEWENPLSSF